MLPGFSHTDQHLHTEAQKTCCIDFLLSEPCGLRGVQAARGLAPPPNAPARPSATALVARRALQHGSSVRMGGASAATGRKRSHDSHEVSSDAMYEELKDRLEATLSAQAARAPQGLSAAEGTALAAAFVADHNEARVFVLAEAQATRAHAVAQAEATQEAMTKVILEAHANVQEQVYILTGGSKGSSA